ncbi:TPA: hypothetical protein SIA29_004088 [Aeromonas sobria]|nr:hypothetical protein [Aeromonas sobria]
MSWINFLCCKFTKIIERVFKCNILYGKGFLFIEGAYWGDEGEFVGAPAIKARERTRCIEKGPAAGAVLYRGLRSEFEPICDIKQRDSMLLAGKNSGLLQF